MAHAGLGGILHRQLWLQLLVRQPHARLSRAQRAAQNLRHFLIGIIGPVPQQNRFAQRLAQRPDGGPDFILFILLPLMILNLVLGTAYISDVFEWSLAFLYIAVVVDIILMTLFYLVM